MNMGRLIKQIRQAIVASGKSRYRIAQESGVAESVLSRLMSGERGVSTEVLERLADSLGFEITLRVKKKRR